MKTAIWAFASFILLALAMLLVYQLWGRTMIADAYQGQSWSFLNRMMEGKSTRPVEYYFSRAEKPLYQLIVILGVMSPLFFAGYYWRLLDRHRTAVLVSLALAVLLISGWISVIRTLWYDELFTFYAASAGTPVAVINGLLGGGDNHPPLDYLFRHLSMQLFGDSTLAFRLPSMLSAILASTCLYLFARKRLSFAGSAVVFAVPFCTFTITYAVEGRHSLPLFAAACLALLAWQRATLRPSSPARLVLLAVALAIGPFIHFYGVFSLVPILVGEAVRTLGTRRICWPIIISIGISQASLVLLYPFLINSIGFSGNFWTSVTPVDVLVIYWRLIGLAVAAFFAMVIAWQLPRRAAGKPSLMAAPGPFPGHEMAAIIAYCLVPLMLYLVAELVTGAFLARYTIIAVIGVALVTGLVVDRINAESQRAAAVAVAYFWLAGVAYLGTAAVPFLTSAPGHARLVEIIENELDEERLPIVIPHAHRYLETYYYLPASSKERIVFIADRALAIEYQGFDTTELAATNLKRVLPINAGTLCEFLEQSTSFIVLGDGGWLMQKLKDDHAEITRTRSRGINVYRVSADAHSCR